MQIGKKEIKLVLFADGMFREIENLRKSTLNHGYKKWVDFKS